MVRKDYVAVRAVQEYLSDQAIGKDLPKLKYARRWNICAETFTNYLQNNSNNKERNKPKKSGGKR